VISVDRNRRLNAQELHDGKVVLQSKPLQINFELIGYCNINPPCLYCSGKNHGYNYAPLDASYLDNYADFILAAEHLNEDSFGEPLMHKKLTELALAATGRGQRFSFVSNGLLLSGRRAEELAACGPLLGFHVSLNAATPETYYKLHGKPFEKVVGNVRDYIETYRRVNDGARPDLILTFIVMQVNKHEVFAFLRLAHELGVRALLAQLHNRPSVPLGNFGYDFVYENELLTPAEYFAFGDEVREYARAEGFEQSLIVQWDPDHDSAVMSFKRQQDERGQAGSVTRNAPAPADEPQERSQAWNYAPGQKKR
jgi:MoaA/NifB/PqqE/SkfB family radical SAM enzyme